MDTQLLARLQELILQGEKLVPEGGLEFSGYNAKKQNQYLLWRKNCLDSISKLGERSALLRGRITNEENGAYFYQSSAQNVLDVIREATDLVESGIPTIMAPSPPPKPAAQKVETQKVEMQKGETPKAETLKAETPKAEMPKAEMQKTETPKVEIPKAETPKAGMSKADPPKSDPPPETKPVPPPTEPQSVIVVSAESNPLLPQLLTFLKDIGVQATSFHRTQGSPSLLVEHVTKSSSAHSAFYLFSGDDTLNEMFELGLLVGRLGSEKIFCIHYQQTPFPASIPGIHDKEIVVKLEEISFSLIKELKAAGYTVSI
jgi:hypothetical protein